jgi:hypothetical protein
MDEKFLGGMTVNERLFASGLLEEFDAAIRAKDKQAALAILERAQLTRAQAVETVEKILAHPAFYGYK